jgi:hypothetical protein
MTLSEALRVNGERVFFDDPSTFGVGGISFLFGNPTRLRTAD